MEVHCDAKAGDRGFRNTSVGRIDNDSYVLDYRLYRSQMMSFPYYFLLLSLSTPIHKSYYIHRESIVQLARLETRSKEMSIIKYQVKQRQRSERSISDAFVYEDFRFVRKKEHMSLPGNQRHTVRKIPNAHVPYRTAVAFINSKQHGSAFPQGQWIRYTS